MDKLCVARKIYSCVNEIPNSAMSQRDETIKPTHDNQTSFYSREKSYLPLSRTPIFHSFYLFSSIHIYNNIEESIRTVPNITIFAKRYKSFLRDNEWSLRKYVYLSRRFPSLYFFCNLFDLEKIVSNIACWTLNIKFSSRELIHFSLFIVIFVLFCSIVNNQNLYFAEM